MTSLPTLAFDNADGPALRAALASDGIVRVTGVPTDTRTLIDTLAPLGEPIIYYGDDAGSHPDHPAIWRVRYDHEASKRAETHALAGPLKVHSSQSLLAERPPYFAMLMVDPGWQDNEPGLNGESLLAPWAEAIRLLAEQNWGDESWQDVLAMLTTSVPFPDGVPRPLLYPLATRLSEHDFGVRFKSSMDSHLQSALPDAAVTEAVKRLSDAAQAAAHRVQLDAGDLVVVDNDRWAHGRESVLGLRRTSASTWETNPRELWSLTLA